MFGGNFLWNGGILGGLRVLRAVKKRGKVFDDSNRNANQLLKVLHCAFRWRCRMKFALHAVSNSEYCKRLLHAYKGNGVAPFRVSFGAVSASVDDGFRHFCYLSALKGTADEDANDHLNWTAPCLGQRTKLLGTELPVEPEDWDVAVGYHWRVWIVGFPSAARRNVFRAAHPSCYLNRNLVGDSSL